MTLHEAVLGKELMKQGFTLDEDEDFAYLYLNGKQVNTYNACKVTVETLRSDATKILSEQNHRR